MKLQLYCLIFFILLLSFSACHTMVEDDFENFKPVPVLNGLLQADSTMRIQISLTANLSDSVPEYVDNALVIIESNANTPDTLSYTSKGWYVSDQQVKAGTTYTCKALIEGFTALSAQTTVPEVTDFDSIVFTEFAGRGTEGEKISSIEFQIHIDLSKKLFWQVQLIAEGDHIDIDYENLKFIHYYGDRDLMIYMIAAQDSILLNEANPLTVFSNKKMKGNKYAAKFYVNQYSTDLDSGSDFYIVLSSIDESYYKYIKQYYIYETSEYFNLGKSPQRYPMYSNVINGYGIFTGISKARVLLKANYVNN